MAVERFQIGRGASGKILIAQGTAFSKLCRRADSPAAAARFERRV